LGRKADGATSGVVRLLLASESVGCLEDFILSWNCAALKSDVCRRRVCVDNNDRDATCAVGHLAVKGEYPDWAFTQCRKRAEAIMDAGKSKDYDRAAEWLRRGRDILLAAGKQRDWAGYISLVMDKHQKKYKLMPMLRALA